MKRSIAGLALMLGVAAHADVQIQSASGAPISRSDAANIQFVLHSSVAPAARNANGALIFTPSSDPAGAIRLAADAWGAVRTAAVRFAPFESTGVLQANASDRRNFITAEDTPEHRSIVGSALAITLYSYDGQNKIIDSDIVISPAIPFSTSHEPGTYDLLGTMTHEFGHALGSAHSPVIPAAMFQASSPFSTFVTGYEGGSQAILSADDIGFVSSVYPAADALSLGSITGHVRFDNGAAVPGAIVIAAGTQGNVVGTVSSLADGSYTLSAIPPGTYSVYAQPMDGPVRPGSFNLPNIAGANTSFRTTLAATQFSVTAGGSTNVDLAVSPLPSGVHIDFIGTGSAGGSDWATGPVKAITDGQSRDLLLWGKGIDATLTESQIHILSGGLAIRPGSLKPFPSAVVNGIAAMRLTVDAPQVDAKTPVVLYINKNGDTAASTGAFFIVPAPRFSSSSIVNAASFKGGAIVPGEVVTVFGSNFGPGGLVTLILDGKGKVATQLADTLMTFDGTPAPVVYALNGQISAIVPYNVVGKTSVNGSISYGGAVSTGVKLSVAPAGPALFTLNSSGAGPGAILNQDSTPNTPAHPAAQGSVVMLYGTGLGTLNPAASDGEITSGAAAAVQSVQVTIGGKDATVLYAGAAPSLVSGVFQINVRLPAGIGSGAIPIVVAVGSASTPEGVTVSVL